MRLPRIIAFLAVLAAVAAAVCLMPSSPRPVRQVTLMRTPHYGIQPQTAVGSNGVVHMIYFDGDPSAGNVEYVRRGPGAGNFSTPIRVNSQPGSAMAVGTVRGPQMALGRTGRVYVVWCGSSKAIPRGRGGATPVLFSRLNGSGTAFMPQRNVVEYTQGVDGGLSVAADRGGNVYVVWHGMAKMPGEAHRRVYLARSTDDGKTFAREVPISPASLGACGCCGMRAFVDSGGTLNVFFRAATGGIHRDMTLLVSTDRGRTFRAARVARWKLDACPMSTDDLTADGRRLLAAWETAGQVYFGEIAPGSLKLLAAVAAPGRPNDRKHPAAGANSRGRVCLAWTEGTAWLKDGSLAWQIFDRTGQPIGPEGHATGVPVWGMPSVFTGPHGNFTIVY